MPLTVSDIAAVCHEAWRELHYAQGNGTRPHWWSAAEEVRQNAEWSVRDRLLNGTDPAAAHNRWVAHAAREGHPNAKPFDQLSPEAQAHGYLFSGIVERLQPYAEQMMTEQHILEEGLA